MTVGFVLGLIVALVFGPQAQVLSPIGDILLNLLQLVVIPIIMLTLIDAVNTTQPGSLVRVAVKTFGLILKPIFCVSAFFSLSFGEEQVADSDAITISARHLDAPRLALRICDWIARDRVVAVFHASTRIAATIIG